MITFTKAASDIQDFDDLSAWSEINNVHIDKVHILNLNKGVMLYESFKYSTKEPVFAAFVIYDAKKSTAWLVLDDIGNLNRTTDAYKNIYKYALNQASRLLNLR